MPSREAGRSKSALGRNLMETMRVFIPGQNCESETAEDIVCIQYQSKLESRSPIILFPSCAISIGVLPLNKENTAQNVLCVVFSLLRRSLVIAVWVFLGCFLPSKLTHACAVCFIPGRIPTCDPNRLRVRERPSAKCQTNHGWNSSYSYRLEL